MLPERYDLSRPENQRKLDAADALGQLADDSGISLVHLAIAFVLQHPAVTAPIIGPRTMEQLETQLGAVDVVLSGDILDRIDEIVPPGLNIAMGRLRLPAAVADRPLAAPPLVGDLLGQQVDRVLRPGEPVLHRDVPVDPQQRSTRPARRGSCS